MINFKNRKRVMDICRDWYELNQSKFNYNYHYDISRFKPSNDFKPYGTEQR